jgi:hypothetical protein
MNKKNQRGNTFRRSVAVFAKGGAAPMVQINGQTGEPEAILQGQERIFSRKHTKQFLRLVPKAKTENGLKQLGEAVFKAIKKQDTQKQEYTKE